MATWNGSEYCQVLLTALWSDCSPVVPSSWTHSQPVGSLADPGRESSYMLKDAALWYSVREASVSRIQNQPGVRSRDAVRVWVLTCFKCRGVCEWELLRGSEVKDGRTEMMLRQVRGWQRAGQRLNCCRCRDLNVARWRVLLASPFCQTYWVNTKPPKNAAVCKTAECWQIFHVLMIKS